MLPTHSGIRSTSPTRRMNSGACRRVVIQRLDICFDRGVRRTGGCRRYDGYRIAEHLLVSGERGQCRLEIRSGDDEVRTADVLCRSGVVHEERPKVVPEELRMADARLRRRHGKADLRRGHHPEGTCGGIDGEGGDGDRNTALPGHDEGLGETDKRHSGLTMGCIPRAVDAERTLREGKRPWPGFLGRKERMGERLPGFGRGRHDRSRDIRRADHELEGGSRQQRPADVGGPPKSRNGEHVESLTRRRDGRCRGGRKGEAYEVAGPIGGDADAGGGADLRAMGMQGGGGQTVA